MKASRFTDARKAFIVKQGEDGMPVAEICCKAGITRNPWPLPPKLGINYTATLIPGG